MCVVKVSPNEIVHNKNVKGNSFRTVRIRFYQYISKVLSSSAVCVFKIVLKKKLTLFYEEMSV